MKQKHDVFGVEMLSHLVLSIQLSREQLTGLTVTKSWHFTTPPTVTRISLSRSFVTHPSHLLWKINTSSSSYCSLICFSSLLVYKWTSFSAAWSRLRLKVEKLFKFTQFRWQLYSLDVYWSLPCGTKMPIKFLHSYGRSCLEITLVMSSFLIGRFFQPWLSFL